MKRKIVLLHGCTSVNLGDDLFFKVVLERYPDTLFLVIAPPVYRQLLSNYKNVKVIDKLAPFPYFPPIVKTKINQLKQFLQYALIFIRYRINIVLIIGGSIFMEHNSDNGSYIKKMFSLKKVITKLKIVILGCNFGPYQNDDYKNNIESVLKLADDVCFRDKISYSLFSTIPTVRLGNDLAMNVNHGTYSSQRKSKVVGINLRNIDNWPTLASYKEAYINKAVELINYFRSKGFEVLMISFCEQYGDEKIISDVIQKLSDKSGISVYEYRGNLKQALEIISTLEYMVATRLHAIILSFLYNIKVLPIAYSNKTKDMLDTYGLWKDSYDLGMFSHTDIDVLLKLFIEKFTLDKKYNVQFEYLDSKLK